jgi:hypothetical protein
VKTAALWRLGCTSVTSVPRCETNLHSTRHQHLHLIQRKHNPDSFTLPSKFSHHLALTAVCWRHRFSTTYRSRRVENVFLSYNICFLSRKQLQLHTPLFRPHVPYLTAYVERRTGPPHAPSLLWNVRCFINPDRRLSRRRRIQISHSIYRVCGEAGIGTGEDRVPCRVLFANTQAAISRVRDLGTCNVKPTVLG